jgi:hypothetical protein
MKKMVNKTTNGLKHGWGTQKDSLILYLLNPSLKHVVEKLNDTFILKA